MNLNKEQQEAVAHFSGPCIVTACPGSGKTSVLTVRVIALIKEKQIAPHSILCLTFTNKAANEMKERVVRLEASASAVWVSTFHKFCLAILRKYGHLINLSPDFTIYASKEQEELMAKVARMHECEASKDDIRRFVKCINDFREDIVDFEHHIKELSPLEVGITQEYLTVLDDLNVVDFSGILYKAWLLMTKNEFISVELSERFKYILVDEMQDTNRIQYDIVKKIATHHSNLFVVGDQNQAIYSFRGARPENLRRLHKDFDDVKEIVLPRNYRSTTQILSMAQQLIRHNKNAKTVNLISDKGHGPAVSIRYHESPEKEAEEVVKNIIRLKQRGDCDWRDCAILYRTNSLSRSPEIVLRQSSVPYKIVGGFSFFDRSEVKTTLAYLSLLANPNDTVAFSRAVSMPKRQIGDVAIGKLERMSQKLSCPIFDTCKNSDATGGLNSKARANLAQFTHTFERYIKSDGSLSERSRGLIHDVGYYKFMKKASKDDPDYMSRLENIDELLSGVEEFEKQYPKKSLSDYLQTIQLMSDVTVTEEENSVTLLTMHAAKGLEWKSVNVIGVEAGFLPHYKSIEERGIEEERRLLYVAMTRSMAHLQMSYCFYRRNRPTGKSMFLDEIEAA